MSNLQLQWLADELSDAGLPVATLQGWDTYTSPTRNGYNPSGILNHHTAGSAVMPNYPNRPFWPRERLQDSCNITIEPDGTVVVLNAGYAYDSGMGDPLVLERVYHDQPIEAPADFTSIQRVTGNPHFVDIEVQHLGDGSPLPAPARESLILTNVVILGHYDWDPMTRLLGHREWTRRKIDPRWDGWSNPMPGIRRDTTKAQGDDMFVLKTDPNTASKRLKIEFWSRQLKRAGQSIDERNTDYNDAFEAALWNVAGYGVGGVGPGEADRILAAVRKAEAPTVGTVDTVARSAATAAEKHATAAHSRLNKLHAV